MRCGPKKAQLKAMRRRPDRDETPGYRSGLELELMSLTSSRSLDVRIHRTIHTQAGIQNPNIVGKSAPHSSEFRHYTPYPDQHRKMQVRKPLGLNP